MTLRYILIVTLLASCSTGSVQIEDLKNQPRIGESDEQYKNVFKMLDGTWKGTFDIYVNENGQANSPTQPKTFDASDWLKPPFKKMSSIDVTQTYSSESPYFQRVEIEDRYVDGKVVNSTGVNKIQDGKMWCVVVKPDDTVIHDGTLEDEKTILWSRSRETPKAFEFFRERVETDTYTIQGWGYYGNDDTTKAPRMFFDATYHRQ